MNINILIGNIISCGAAIFTLISSLSHGQKKIYRYQGYQCLLLAIANIFFGSFAGVSTLLLCSLRNFLMAYGKLSRKILIGLLILIPIIGIISNNRGLVGYIPIVSTIAYSLGQYLLRGDFKIKVNICLNLILWVIYDIFILDIVSIVVDTITVIATAYAVVKERIHPKE